ncbi:uncharacterized protein [Gossypium hirsutum]|uniref:Uncharacterized protein isoform X2 n=1 Tax=Gossypium hirsutum TaxID=3635 RepID=A0ABM3BSD9_GOSHI|nr:uncharacterized protein LOC121229491 isoform X2 [Gossypium hirsutum]
MSLRGRRTKHINFPFRESAQTPPTKQHSAVSTPLFKNKDFFFVFHFQPPIQKKQKSFHALFPSLKILSSLFFSGEIPVTGPPPLVAPPPSPATAHGGRKFKSFYLFIAACKVWRCQACGDGVGRSMGHGSRHGGDQRWC